MHTAKLGWGGGGLVILEYWLAGQAVAGPTIHLPPVSPPTRHRAHFLGKQDKESCLLTRTPGNNSWPDVMTGILTRLFQNPTGIPEPDRLACCLWELFWSATKHSLAWEHKLE